MSSASTPMKQRLASRSQSPNSPLGSTPAELSPWSKIRAEVLGPRIDAEDGGASTLAKQGEHGSEYGADESDKPQGQVPRELSDSDGLSESDETPRRPVGRMAARLMGTKGDAEVPAYDGDAYARVKSLLLGRKDEATEEQLDGIESTAAKTMTSSLDNRNLASSVQAPSSPQRSPSLPPRNSSPSLFVSPHKHSTSSPVQHETSADSGSDSDELPADLMRNARFNELVAKKRAERRAREQAANEKAEESRRRAAAKLSIEVEQLGNILSAEADSDDDRRVRKRLTQQSRPARKASKKALEDMNRETQRLARNQQLAHQAMVKKKFTTKDLFKRFSYKQDDSTQDHPTSRTDDEFVMSGALTSSDAEARRAKDTPPSSPPSPTSLTELLEKHADTPGTIHHNGNGESYDNTEDDLPTLEEIMSQPIVKIDKGKASLRPGVEPSSITSHRKPISSKQDRWMRSLTVTEISNPADDSNDEIEIVGKPRIAVFDRLPTTKRREPRSLLNLRALAHLTSPSKIQPKGRKSLTSCELQLQLQQRARKQALLEKQERIADLQAKGVIIQTEEEREKEQLELENLLEKARHEAMELAKREKEAAKKEGRLLPEDFEDSDDEEDGEYEESDVEEEEDDVEFSGSEEEGIDGGDDNEEEKNDETTADDTNLLSNNAIEENDFAEPEAQPDAAKHQTSNVRRRKIVLDEDDDEPNKRTPVEKDVLQPPKSSAMAAFGFATPAAGHLGLTQIFAGTMADLDTQPEDNQPTIMHLLQQSPTPLLPEPERFSATSPDVLVQDSQSDTTAKSQDQNLRHPMRFAFSQLPIQEQSITSPTKLSEIPEPTQDAGFEKPHSVHPALPELHSSIETVVLPFEEPPVVQNRVRLHRRTKASATLSDHDDETPPTDTDVKPDNDFQLSTNVFDVLFKAAKKTGQVDDFDKKKSEAKNMVEEQAEESEDEYAGLGGASDEESDGEVDEEVARMIDESHVEVNESKLAQLYADKERASDEKAIDKLYKDITTGLLRRKRQANFDDLSDSDDAAAERRRRKQLEFARMRKALLEDENIGKIAENPKKLAFLRAIEDRDEEDDMDFLDGDIQADSVPDSQTCQESEAPERQKASPVVVQPSDQAHQQHAGPATAGHKTSRLSHRRPGADASMSRPTTIAEIRESLSFLVDEPLVPDSQRSDSDSEDEDNDAMDVDATTDTSRQGGSRRVLQRASVVNRVSTVRAENEDPHGPMAFHAPASTSTPTFKVPSLLRRATTLSSTSNSSSGASTATTESNVRMGGSKKSNIHYQAREAERKKIVEAADRKRKEEVKKSVRGTGRRSMLGVLGSHNSGFE